MSSRTRRVSRIATFCLVFLAVAALTRPAWPQTPADESYVAVITTDEVPVRCGAAESYYPFGKLEEGDLIEVVGEKFNWARVRLIGPAFRDFFGYVCIPKTESGRFRLEADGKKARTLGSIDLVAPNLNTNYDPRNSWKALLILEPDTELTVLEASETERQLVYRVHLPEQAEGWISTSFVAKAGRDQVAAWNRALTQPQTETKETKTAGGATGDEAEPVLAREEQEIPPVVEQPKDEEPTGPAGERTPTPVAEETPPEPDEPAVADADEGAAPDASRPPAAPTLSPTAAQEKLEDLEAVYRQLLDEPIETAEVLPLRDLYLKLADEHPESRRIVRYASARAEQLELWADLQQRRAELGRLRKRLELSAEEAEAIRRALEASADYAAVGRLVASTVYDGDRQPQLYRIQDASTGRTIAYLRPNEEFKLTEMLGQLAGIVGRKTYDEGLRLNLVEPQRIDLLAPQR
ncbi:MAG: hypothetical protein SYC29_03080 [Planctomycetota bacterium]|nr:hypothetical protein [Planctomycetota bacterium]